MSNLDFYNLILTWPKLILCNIGHTSICVKYLFSEVDDFCGCQLFYSCEKRFTGPGRLHDWIFDSLNFVKKIQFAPTFWIR